MAKFKQLLTRQISDLIFPDLASKTPCDRTLKRLHQHGYLSHLSFRAVGGDGGGSGQHVHQIGREGWRLLELPGKYWVYRSVNMHSIELSELYVVLKALEREGKIEILRCERDQEGWREVGGVQITPDLSVELGFPATRTKVGYYIELDRGTERADKIQEKLSRYGAAYRRSNEMTFPFVMFAVPDDQRRMELEAIISGAPEAARGVFRVCLLSTFRKFVDTPT